MYRSRSRRRKKYSGNGDGKSIQAFIAKTRHQDPQPQQSQTVKIKPFVEFDLHPKLQANILELGFSDPTPIQQAAIEPILSGKDIVGIAQTGTGKTGAFLIPVIDKLLQNPDQKAIMIAPTRELAIQIKTVFAELTKDTQLRIVTCIGGSNIRRQMDRLQKKHQVVVGTPGRILDLIERKKIFLNTVSTVILDEVDRMLDMGFIHDIKEILSNTPANKQSLYFSATINNRVSRLISEFSKDVQQVMVDPTHSLAAIDHQIIKYQTEEKKLDTLLRLLEASEVTKSIIFGKTKHGVKKLMFKLRDSGFKAESIHGNKTQHQRQKALDAFRDSQVTVLVATDVAARGIDVDDVSHVINYDLPQTVDEYIHRTGRTGRAGKKGTAYTFFR